MSSDSAIRSDTLVMKSINEEGGFFFEEGGIFQKLVSVGSTSIREMRVIRLVRFSLKYHRVWKRLATIIFFEICRYVSRKFI